jgi:sterol 3beta-glucosyltransferase
MILPKSEIISIAKNNAFRYGQHGLVIVVRGHEELFLEFASTLRRDQCISLIEMQLKGGVVDTTSVDAKRYESLLLTDLGQRLSAHAPTDNPPLEDSLKLFNSATSAFLSTKPKENLHITFLTIGSRGDVQPYIALAKGLKQEGHSVRIATHKEFQTWIESYDIEFREVGGDPAELMKICVENGTFTMAFLRESMTKFRGWLDDLLISCWHACQGTDVIVESPSAIAGIHVAEALQVPYYRSFTMPWTRTRVYPHAFAVPGHKAGGNYNYMSYVIFDQVFWRASAGQINSWRRECLGLKPTSLDKLEQHKVPFLYNFSPYLVPKPIDWYDWIHVTGFWFLDHADESGRKEWTPPADLVDFIAKTKQAGRKLVYIGWGSIVVSDAEAMTRTVMQAVEKSGVCAILSKGWSDRLQSSSRGDDFNKTEDEEETNPNVFNIQSIPHDWLFPQLDAACHHGGSGTLGASLRAGIPTIVKPYFGDQFFWASQVESLHIGSFVRNFTVDTFAQALLLCTSDVKMIENAKKIGAVIRKEDGVGNAIKAFYGDWEYAYSRIPRGGSLSKDMKRTAVAVGATAGRSIDEEQSSTPIVAEGEEEDDGLDGWSVVSGSEDDIPGM